MAATSSTVSAIEDRIVAALNDLGGLRIQEGNFPYRPGYGSRGTAVTLIANYFEVRAANKLVLHRYNIQITPVGQKADVSGKKREQVVRLLLRQHLGALRTDIVTDFRQILLCRQRAKNDTATFEIVYHDEEESDSMDNNSPRFRVTLQYAGSVATADLISYLTSTDPSVVAFNYNTQPIVQALDIFLIDYAKTNYQRLAQTGRSKTFSLDAASCDIGGGLKVIRGFFSSIRVAQSRLLVNINVKHGVFYHSGPLDGLMEVYLGKGQNHPISKLQAMEVFLQRLRITTAHDKKQGRSTKRSETIFGLAYGCADDTEARNIRAKHLPKITAFASGANDVSIWLGEGGQGRYIKLAEFFRDRHGITLKKPHLPVVTVGSQGNITYLPPEVCFVSLGQPARQQLNAQQTQEMIKFTVRRPASNKTSILNDGLRTVGLTSAANPAMNQFGLQVNSNLISVQSRVLPHPKVLYAANSTANITDASWNVQGKRFRAPGKCLKWSWVVITIPGRTNQPLAYYEPTINRFRTALAATGVTLSTPQKPYVVNLTPPDDANLDSYFQFASKSLDLLFLILPSDNNIYNRVKKLGDQRSGITTICMIGEKLTTKGIQYYSNVAHKVNLKLGGSNQAVNASSLPLVSEGNTMIVGIDVTHPSPGSHTYAPSIAAMVANVDTDLGQWPAAISLQTRARQEMATDLKGMLKTRLALWNGKKPRRPDNILVYRDGVSEGQYQQVVEQELPLLREACKEYYPAEDTRMGLPRFTIIVVGKRHNTRFYPTNPKDGDRNGNPKPGTIVDRGVTEARTWDFFLQPHTAIQGTARPAHYFVVLDEIFRTQMRRGGRLPPGYKNVAEIVEDLTHSLCYIFGRATRGVSICTPAYYADIACERARCYLSNLYEAVIAGSAAGARPARPEDVKIHDRLLNTMFYI